VLDSQAPEVPLVATEERNFAATAERASAGQGVNQSIVQQLTSDGNCRSRSLQADVLTIYRDITEMTLAPELYCHSSKHLLHTILLYDPQVIERSIRVRYLPVEICGMFTTSNPAYFLLPIL
jgi:hypothetical protein